MIPGRTGSRRAHGLPWQRAAREAWGHPGLGGASPGAIERSNQAALLAELRATQGWLKSVGLPLKELADTVPRKDTDAG